MTVERPAPPPERERLLLVLSELFNYFGSGAILDAQTRIRTGSLAFGPREHVVLDYPGNGRTLDERFPGRARPDFGLVAYERAHNLNPSCVLPDPVGPQIRQEMYPFERLHHLSARAYPFERLNGSRMCRSVNSLVQAPDYTGGGRLNIEVY